MLVDSTFFSKMRTKRILRGQAYTILGSCLVSPITIIFNDFKDFLQRKNNEFIEPSNMAVQEYIYKETGERIAIVPVNNVKVRIILNNEEKRQEVLTILSKIKPLGKIIIE